ncbi:MAG: amidohydrolase family protein [Treponema sp.]|nr:amidohydrolase family protein [Treponema sp.]
MSDFTLRNGIIVSGAGEPAEGALGVREDRIAPGRGAAFDLGGVSCVYPGLINTHDHLQGNYRPPVGPRPGTYYLTWLPWDNDLKASSMFQERSNLSREDLYHLSGYKCLFSGVTTVNDHFPQKFNAAILPTLPVRAILEYGLAHEASSYDLKWGDGLEIEHRRALKNNWPFITHLAEGFDEEAMNGVNYLEKKGILDDHCLLIHCIGFSDRDIEKVAAAGASVAWCGFSNKFMFNVTCKIRKMLRAGINVSIGTDSAATGSANILEEMRYDRELYRSMYGEDLPAKTLFGMVTVNGARAFRMDRRLGTLEEGKLADILVLKARRDDPFENLVNAAMEDIELLTLAGTPIYGEHRFLDALGGGLPRGYTNITVGGRPMFIKGDPAGLYRSAREKIGFKKVLDFLPFEPEEIHA